MSSELTLVAVEQNRINVQKRKSKRPSISTDRLFESLREERYSSNQKAAREFIEQTLGSKLFSNDMHEALKDGVLLCSLMNRLQPDAIPQISHKDLPFVKMENISNFLNAARQFGLHTSDLFQTVDLFEGKHMERVIATILAIARVVEGKYVRRNSDVSIEQPVLDKLKDLDIKENDKIKDLDSKEREKSELIKVKNLEINENEKLNSNNNDNNNSDNITEKIRRKPTESEKIFVDSDPNSIIHNTSEASTDSNDTNNSQSNELNFGVNLPKKKPSLRKSVTMGQLFVKTAEQKREEEQEHETEFVEDLAPLPISPAPTKSEKPVSRNNSTRSNKKTHVRYKSDRTSEISLNKNEKISGPGDYRRRESVGGTSSSGDLLREKLVLKNDDEVIAQYQLGNCIGKGQFGAVYRALHLGTGQMVAVKRIKLEGRTPDEIEQLMQEVELLKSLSHPSVVKYEAFIMTNDHINIILEYVENGSLLHTLKAFGNFPEKLVVSYVVKILEGLVYLHTKQVVHCDLKAANILTTKNGNVKLSDFGVSLNLKMMEQVCTEVAGTPNWMAPEVIELKGASTASDIWSLGCTIIELLTGKPPYSDLLAMTALFRIVEDDCPPLPESISDDLTDFLKKCFHKKPSMRPTARDLFRHEWIKSNWSQKELRTQESLPFLRRITSDTKLSEIKPSSLSNVSNINDSKENSNNESPIKPESTTPSSKKPIDSPNVAIIPSVPTKLYAATPMVPHRFVKNSFSKPIGCKICHTTVKKNAVMCEECNMVCHAKCSPEAPFPCSLQNHLIRYIPLGLIEDPLTRSIGTSSESDVPTITSPINSLPTTSTPTPPKRNSRFTTKKTKKEDSVNSQISITDSVDSSASVTSSSNMADSSWFGNNSRPSSSVDNISNGGGKGSGKGKASKLKKKTDNGSNGNLHHGKKDDDCVIM
ncbi:kinase-like domain-containing protein [Glomus cerebriforme]|uniref:Kinase-like domain-containing protein n=1 Tax=Glomus cerebriforme TaxID=658196 RepID=A0A397T256_9GLOM|nr:kinase-like domain-containing protein [Glomus cerebriforme]